MKINKKATLATAGVLTIAALAGVIGTMSYFSDTAEKTNVFTIGNVDITLNDQKRGVDGTTGCKSDDPTKLVDFNDATVANDTYYPLVSHDANGNVVANSLSASTARFDSLGMPVEYGCGPSVKGTVSVNNFIDKMVSVKNEGEGDAYVRVYYALPLALLDGDPVDTNETFNVLHTKEGKAYKDSSIIDTDISAGYTIASQSAGTWNWTNGHVGAGNKLDQRNYILDTTNNRVIYYADYSEVKDGVIVPKKLASGETTDRALNGFYLDSNLEVRASSSDPTKQTYWMLGANGYYDTGWDVNTQVTIPVYAIAVQGEGFVNVDEAITAAKGANFNPFAQN